MYFYAGRIRVVEFYFKFGKRIGATVRQLGYLTKNALKDGAESASSSRSRDRAA